jgi:hypothetical protein
MIEEILKKLCEKRQRYIEQKCSGLSFNDDEYEAYILMNYIDKYNNQPDYKGAWEELREELDSDTLYELAFYKMQEIEKKYNIGWGNTKNE